MLIQPTIDRAIGCEDCRIISAAPTETGRCPVCNSSSWFRLSQREDQLALLLEIATREDIRKRGQKQEEPNGQIQ